MPTPEQVEAAKHLSEAHQKANRDAGKEPCDCPVCIIAAALRESEARVKELESRHENLVPERDQARAEAFCFRQERDEQKARAEKAEAECAKYKERWLRSKGSEDARIPHQRVFALLLSFKKMRLRLARLRAELAKMQSDSLTAQEMGGDREFAMQNELARLRAELDAESRVGIKTVNELTAALRREQDLRAEVERLRKVVEAAKDVRLEWNRGHITVFRNDDGSWPMGTASIMDRFENALRDVSEMEEGHGKI